MFASNFATTQKTGSEQGSVPRDKELPETGREERNGEWEEACEPTPAAGAPSEVQLAAQTTDDTRRGRQSAGESVGAVGRRERERKKMCKKEKRKNKQTCNDQRPKKESVRADFDLVTVAADKSLRNTPAGCTSRPLVSNAAPPHPPTKKRKTPKLFACTSSQQKSTVRVGQ